MGFFYGIFRVAGANDFCYFPSLSSNVFAKKVLGEEANFYGSIVLVECAI